MIYISPFLHLGILVVLLLPAFCKPALWTSVVLLGQTLLGTQMPYGSKWILMGLWGVWVAFDALGWSRVEHIRAGRALHGRRVGAKVEEVCVSRFPAVFVSSHSVEIVPTRLHWPRSSTLL